jgi:hypothetical protein
MKSGVYLFALISVLSFGQIAAKELGWTDDVRKTMTNGCVLGLLNPAKRDFQARADQSGAPNAVFPEEKVRPSLVALCACITERAAESWSYQQFLGQPHLADQLIEEALSGGRCKPTGMLGQALESSQ